MPSHAEWMPIYFLLADRATEPYYSCSGIVLGWCPLVFPDRFFRLNRFARAKLHKTTSPVDICITAVQSPSATSEASV